MSDLMLAVQEAVFATLDVSIDPATATVAVNLEEDTAPPFVLVGEIAEDANHGKGSDLSRFEVTVHSVYRGTDRRQLLAIMFAVKQALNGAAIAWPGAAMQPPTFMDALADSVAGDGVTYAGASTFEIWAEPD